MVANRPEPESKRRAKGEVLSLFLALFLALAAALPALIGPGIVNTRAGGDSPFLILRTHQLAQSLRAGALPVRWMPEAAYGLGYPAFHYYAALPYYVSALAYLGGLGVLGGIKLAQALGFLLAGGAMYALARVAGLRRTGAVVASVAYTYAPFHLVNVYVRGDALSEFYAMALFPFLLWLALLTAQRPSLGRFLALAVAYAALSVTHNISALIFTPFLGLWLLGANLPALRQKAWRPLAAGVGALAFGLALGAWFWLPALADRGLVQLHEQTTGYFHYAGHFREWDLVQRTLVFDYRLDGAHDPFRMGLLQLLVALGGALAVAWRWKHLGHWRRGVALLAVCTLILATWLITPLSAPLWEHLPFLAYTQFPWRFLSIQALAVALLAGYFIMERRWAWMVAAGLILLIMGSHVARLDVDRLAVEEADITPYRLMLYEAYSGNVGGTVRHEYLPVEMWPRPYTSGVLLNGGAKPTPVALNGGLEAAECLAYSARGETWRLHLAWDGQVVFHTTGFPAWRAAIDGVPWPVETASGLGLVSVQVPAGEHVVTLRLERTRAAWWAERFSLAAGVAWLGLLGYALWREPRYRWLALGVGTLLLWLGAWLLVAEPAETRPMRQGPLVMDYVRAPYLHHLSGGVQMGAARLVDYTLSATAFHPGDTLEVRTQWEGVPRGAILRVEMVALTAHLFPESSVWARGEGPVVESEARIALPLPAILPPGLYVLRPTLFVDGVAQPMMTSDGRALGLLALAPVQVLDVPPPFESPGALAAYGPPENPPVITLREAHAYRTKKGVEIALLWRCEAQAPRNYRMSVRIRAADGAQILARDLPPLEGNYPTFLWRPGHLYADALRLEIPAEADAARATDVEIVLYDLQTLAAIGSVSIPIE